MSILTRAPLALITVLVAPNLAARAQCLDWKPGFGAPGVSIAAEALAWFDDGSGNGTELFVGGSFTFADGVPASNIARWNGTSWSAVGGGLPDIVSALCVYDDGAGPKLYAAVATSAYTPGSATVPQVARWDGASWTHLPGGVGLNAIQSMVVWDDGSGSGPGLYMAGRYFPVASPPDLDARNIVRYDAAGWHAVGGGVGAVSNGIDQLLVHDDGSGPALYACGLFKFAGGALANRVARWNGTSWSALASGVGVGDPLTSPDICSALAPWNDGVSTKLVAGGLFASASGVPVQNLAAWDGVTWAPFHAADARVTFLEAVEESPLAPRLWIAGDFAHFDGIPAPGLVRADGGSVSSPISVALSSVEDVTTAVIGGSTHVLMAGQFSVVGGTGAAGVAAFDPATAAWSSIGAQQGFSGAGTCALPFDDGSGDALYVGGAFRAAGSLGAVSIARWNGASWSTVGDPLVPGPENDLPSVSVLGTYDDPVHGRSLILGGRFLSSGGTTLKSIARWDGAAWRALGTGFSYVPTATATVQTMVEFDDGMGGGRQLYVAGSFLTAGGVSAAHVARWNGSAWSAVGAGFDSTVYALAVFDDGGGPKLYAGGAFRHSESPSIFVNRIARWNGTLWVPLANGTNGEVWTLYPFDDGAGLGTQLCVGGSFTSANGVAAGSIARWNGATWSALGSGVLGSISTLLGYDDGAGGGPKLVASGDFVTSSGTPANRIASWNGSFWSALGNGCDHGLRGLAVWSGGSATTADLYVTGSMTIAGSTASVGIARYGPTGAPGCASSTGVAFCAGDGSATACPCGNVGFTGHGCDNAASTGGGRLAVEGQAHVSADTITLRATDLMPNAMCLFIQGTAQLNGGAGEVFGDGLRCVGGSVIRLRLRQASAGSASLGAAIPGDPRISTIGYVTSGNTTRHYQAWYRDPQSFCTASTFNLTNGASVRWAD